MLSKNDKIAVVACSNPLTNTDKEKVLQLSDVLKDIGLLPVFSKYIFAENTFFKTTAKEKAEELLEFYADNSIKAIFDISGGDIANSILEHLDYTLIKDNSKPFWGYSDLTTIINAIFTKTGNCSYLYQIKNLIWENGKLQRERFRNSVLDNKSDIFDINWSFIQGKEMKGVVVGGNIRCFLKLAGTPYMPEFKDKILFLESLGGGAEQVSAYFNQLKQMNAFSKVSGVLLGTFTSLENEKTLPEIISLIKDIIDNSNLPIAKTQEIGHGKNSKCIIIGKQYQCIG